MRMEREREEMEQKLRAEEEAKRRMKEEEEAAARRALQEQQEEREKKRGSVISRIGNFFSGKGSEQQKEPSPVKEVDPAEQVSISSAFYKQFICSKTLCAAFLYLQFVFVIFWRK